MKTFYDLIFTMKGDALRALTEFANGYGVSVIRNSLSYGGSEGFYELAVFHDGRLCYTTPITNDVIGWLSPDDVTDLMRRVAALPERKQNGALE